MSGRTVCFVSSEVAPFSKTGGLADVAGALPKYLSAEGFEVRVFTPLYDSIDTSSQNFYVVDFLKDINIWLGDESISFTVITSRIPHSNVDVYFIDCPRLYHRGSIYTSDVDEYLRYALLSRAALECCQRMGWSPSVIHCNDWQTGLIPLYLRSVYHWDQIFHDTKTVLTIHNIAYQGVFGSDIVPSIGLADHVLMFNQSDLNTGVVNFLKTGITYADVITTVSNTYAQEIQTEEYGAGLESLLRRRRNSLIGIVNGVDYNEWSPEHDRLIQYDYSASDLSGKEKNKQSLLASLDLSYSPGVPVLGMVTRLTAQKGIDLFFDILPSLLSAHDFRLVVLGSGEEKYESFFNSIHQQFRHKACFYRGFQTRLSHMIEAGSDIFLMPSQYEPCGLNQIYSLRYGTIPVVRKTGGLADTVQSFDPDTGEGTGFVFEHYTPEGLRWGIETALATYYDRNGWHRLMLNAMARNYSWEAQVGRYAELYAALGAV
ncbi:MAG: hypothetical protein JWQ98_2173 [Chlorobi bacterium]|nr:hypothetical protein [Chlorobiota bacterium]